MEEKPAIPKSNYVITELYFYDNGENEITTVNEEYLKLREFDVELVGRRFTWLDTGKHESLIEASNFIKTIEDHQGIKISAQEEIRSING